MAISDRIVLSPQSGIIACIVLSFALMLCSVLATTAYARERTIVVDEKNPPKTRKIRPSGNTKVVNIRGKAEKGEAPAAEGDICPVLGGYYCKQVGRDAWLREGGIYLGLIKGVAWRDRGQPIGLYIGAGAEGGDTESSIEKFIEKNALSKSDAFYFIIEMPGQESPALVEPYRINTGEQE